MDKFNRLVGLLFGKLYEEFPVSLKISPVQFLDQVIEKNDAEGSFNFKEYFESTIRWLESAGYIWITHDNSDDTETEFEIVLSEKGLSSLRRVPTSLDGNASLGERFLDFAKTKTSETISTLISLAITSAGS